MLSITNRQETTIKTTMRLHHNPGSSTAIKTNKQTKTAGVEDVEKSKPLYAFGGMVGFKYFIKPTHMLSLKFSSCCNMLLPQGKIGSSSGVYNPNPSRPKGILSARV